LTEIFPNKTILYQFSTGFDLQRSHASALFDIGLSLPQITILSGLYRHWTESGLPEDFIEKNLVTPSCVDQPFEEERNLEMSFQMVRQVPYTSGSVHHNVHMLQKAARRNSSLAMAYLSWIHSQKELHVLPFDTAEAQTLAAQSLLWLESASKQGDPFAQCMLGEFYHLGNSVTQSYEEAVGFFKLAADQGHAEGQFLLARAYLSGQGVPRNDTRAYELYALAAAQGHVLANFRAGLCHKYAWGVEEPKSTNETKRWQWTDEELEDKEDEEQEERDEIVVSENSTWIEDTWVRLQARDHYLQEQNSLPFFRAAADRGHIEAAYFTAEVLSSLAGTAKYRNSASAAMHLQAHEYYTMAADNGHRPSQAKLGVAYKVGRGEPKKDLFKAMHYFKLAADQGDHKAEFMISELYLNEQDVRNEEEGMKYLIRAADGNGMFATRELAQRYDEGRGVKQDFSKALEYYRRNLVRDKEQDERIARLTDEGY